MARLKKIISFFRRNENKEPINTLDIETLPEHIAVIMDGNGRWANRRGDSRITGHKRGKDAVKNLLKSCIKYKIKHVSIFAFSSENWNRPKEEVNALMSLLANALETQIEKINENGIRLQFIGELSALDTKIQDLAERASKATARNNKLIFTVAINYGGRWDITQACKSIAEKIENHSLTSEEVSQAVIDAHLVTKHIPDPDLIIRTSGELRISNFYLWQAAYAELYFTDTLWPDFDESDFMQALLAYGQRNRRFGNAQDCIK